MVTQFKKLLTKLSSKHFFIAIFLLMVLVLLFSYLTISPSLSKIITKDFVTSCSGVKEIRQTQQCVEEWFQNYGQEVRLQDAMNIINSKYRDSRFNLNSCHAWKHLVMQAYFDLSKIKTEDALLACKEDNLMCDGGCLHSVVEETIARNGLGSIPNLKKLCLDLRDTESQHECIHGIGHGLARLINDRFTLLDALEYCDKIVSTDDLRVKCYSGVFHITNLAGNTNKTGSQASYLNTQNSLCANLPEKYQGSCYTEFPKIK